MRVSFSFIVVLIFCFAGLVFTDCSEGKRKNRKKKPVVLTKGHKAVLYLRPERVAQFFTKYKNFADREEMLHSFYEKRHFAAAWLNNNSVNEHAGNFINLLNQEKNYTENDSALGQDRIHWLYRQLRSITYPEKKDSLAPELELLLTINFFDYAKRNWGVVDDTLLKKVNWFIERKHIDYEQLLDTFLHAPRAFTVNEPVYRQYGLLKNELKKYNEIAKEGGWPELPDGDFVFKPGDTSDVLVTIKEQLYIMGDMENVEEDSIFSEDLQKAVVRFQIRHGLEPDGAIAKATLKELRVSVRERIQQILINMERSKWVPFNIQGDYLAANIPEFKLHIYQNDKLAYSMNVIVGKSDPVFNTVIFNDTVEMVVFSPYWNIPKNILAMETLPEIKKNPRYLEEHNMEVVDRRGKPVPAVTIKWNDYTDKFPYIIREKPGPDNSLGSVKFLFPNPYDIYLHDTPAKSLFKEPARAFSHGCIRVQEPAKLAKILLKYDTSWTDEKIQTFMTGGKETFVKLKKKVPVFIAYFTAFVDRNGQLNFREDVYKHDEKMKDILFVNY